MQSSLLSCPSCQAELKLKSAPSGKKVRCPKCGSVFDTTGAVAQKPPEPTALPKRDTISDSDHPEQVTRDLPANLSSDTNSHAVPSPQQEQERDHLGPYRLLKVLGEGGMGRVYLAEDPKLKRKVALKVMRADLASDEKACQRFLREAQAQAAIEHDHIIAIFHVGEDNGVPFIEMPLLKGETLADYLKREKRLPLAEVVRIGAEIVEGLAAAHAQDLIHRDIKPGNIWLEGDRRRVKILDFGLARAVASSDQQHLTRTGAVIGTPAYMSPEQAEGVQLDGRSDLFSLGCVLYQLATGELPFQGPTTIAILHALAFKEPTPPRSHNPDLPAELEELILRLLAKERDDRPASAGEVARLLESMAPPRQSSSVSTQQPAAVAARNTGVQSAPVQPTMAPSAETTAMPPRHRSSVLVGVLFLAAAIAIVAGIVLFWQTPQGTVRLESDDPSVEIVFDKTGPTIKGADKEPIALQAGAHGIVVKRGDFSFTTDKLLVKKGDTITLKAELLAGKIQLIHNGEILGGAEMPIAKEETIAKLESGPLPKEFKNSLGMEFVLVPKGKSWLGGGGDKPGEQEVEIKDDFYLGKYEVTQEEWQKLTGLNPSKFKAVEGIEPEEQKRFPVERVSWNDAQEFIKLVNDRANEAGWIYRLPAEMEWEYACRGGPLVSRWQSAFDFYFQEPTNMLLPTQANFAPELGKGLQRTCKVGSYSPNALGLHDMHGNVREWSESKSKPLTDGMPRALILGGSSNLGSKFCRAAGRDVGPLSTRADGVGLRLARVPIEVNATLTPAKPATPTPKSDSALTTELSPSAPTTWKPIPIGQSPFDKLDPKEIPAEERFDWQPKELVAVIGSHARRHWHPIGAVAVSPDGKLAATGLVNHEGITIYDVDTQTPKWTVSAGHARYTLRFTPDGRRLIYGKDVLGILDLTGLEPAPGRFAGDDKPGALIKGTYAWPLEGGKTLVVWADETKLTLFDVSGERPQPTAQLAVSRPAVAEDANVVIYATPEGKLCRTIVQASRFEDTQELPIPLAEGERPRAVRTDGKRLALWNKDHLEVWDLSQPTAKAVARIKGPVTFQHSYVFSPDARWLATKYTSTALYRIDGPEPKFVAWLDQTNSNNGAMAFSRDGNRAVVGTGEGFVRFWDLSASEPKELSPLDMDGAFRTPRYDNSTVLDQRNARLFLSRYDAPRLGNRYQLWDLAHIRPQPTTGPAAFLDTERLGPIFQIGADRWLQITPASPQRPVIYKLTDMGWSNQKVTFGDPGTDGGGVSADGRLLVAYMGSHKELKGWDLSTTLPTQKWTASLRDAPVFSASSQHRVWFAPDGSWFATRSAGEKTDGPWKLLLWRNSGPAPETAAVLPIHQHPSQYVATFSPDGRSLAHTPADTQEFKGTIVFVDLTGKEPKESARIPDGYVPIALAFHPDGKKLARAGSGVIVIDLATQKTLWQWTAPGTVRWLEWADDGRHLVIHNDNKTVYVLRLNDLGGEPAAKAQ